MSSSAENKDIHPHTEPTNNNSDDGQRKGDVKKLLSLWRNIESQGEREAKETQMYNERKLKQSGRQYSYLSNSKRGFSYMNFSESSRRQSDMSRSAHKYDRFGNLVVLSSAPAATAITTEAKHTTPAGTMPVTTQKAASEHTSSSRRAFEHENVNSAEEVPFYTTKKGEEEKEDEKQIITNDPDDEEIPIGLSHAENNVKNDIDKKQECVTEHEEKVTETSRETKEEIVEKVEEAEETVVATKEVSKGEEFKSSGSEKLHKEKKREKRRRTEKREKSFVASETEITCEQTAEADTDKKIYEVVNSVEATDKCTGESDEATTAEGAVVVAPIITPTSDTPELSKSGDDKKKKKRKDRKSTKLEAATEETPTNDDDDKKKKYRKRKNVDVTTQPDDIEQQQQQEEEEEEEDEEEKKEPLVVCPVTPTNDTKEEEEEEKRDSESHKKQKKRRSRSCGRLIEEHEEKEELTVSLDATTEATEAAAVIATEKEEDKEAKKKRRHHSKTKSQDETCNSGRHHHHRSKRNSSVSGDETILTATGAEGEENKETGEQAQEKPLKDKEGRGEEKDKKKKKKRSSSFTRENTRKLSLGNDEIAATETKGDAGISGVLNDNWKKKKAWATLGANDVNKPFSEMDDDDKAIMRGKYETEIVETESDYIEKLKVIKELYMAPLLALTKTGNDKNAIITQAQILHIFSNIDIILTYNTVLYKQMREWKEKTDAEKAAAAKESKKKRKHQQQEQQQRRRRDSEGDCLRTRSLGTIFLTLTDFLKTYISYCNNYLRALETINELKEKNKRFVEFINECQLDERSEGLDLNMLIIMPIQRIPRYVLLLKDVLKYTPESDLDHEKLTLALGKMMSVADDLNKKKKDAEDRELLRHVEKKLIFSGSYGDFGSLLAVQSRRYIGEGDGTVVCPSVEKGKPKGMHIFLFNDLLCFTKPSISGGKYKVVELFKVIDSEISIAAPAVARKDIPSLPPAVSSALPALEVICFSGSSDINENSNEDKIKPFAFYAEDPATTKKWFSDLKTSQDTIKRSAQTFKDAVVRASITQQTPPVQSPPPFK